MITRFGKIMLYVRNPEANALFWVEKLGFSKGAQIEMEGKVFSIELIPYPDADTHLVVLDQEVVARMSDLLDLTTPSILFASNDVHAMRSQLQADGVEVGKIVEMGGQVSFNFSDNEGHWFAVEEVKA
ncbi:MAG: VOC family protein [Erysipelotrichaceae bacterium]